MSKTFRAWKIDEPLLLPVTVQEFVRKDRLARFVLSVVEEELDLREVLIVLLQHEGAATVSSGGDRAIPPWAAARASRS
jgi:hypothetical protein